MKIAMIGQKGIPAVAGGVEKHVEELAERLVKQGYEVTVYCRNTYMTQAIEEYKGVKLKIIKTINLKSLDAIVYSFKATVSALFEGYDIYHYHALGPASMCFLPRILGKKVIVTVHGLDWQREKWGKFGKAYLKFGEFIAGHFAGKIISVSDNLKKYFMDKYNRKEKDVIYIPNCVNLIPCREPQLIKKIGLEGNDYILFLARLVPEKGLHYLIEAYNNIKTEVKLVIAGGTSFSDDYIEKIHNMAENNENIIFTGNALGELLEELYSNCILYVLPSDIEGMPLSLLEALSYGKRVLVSDIPENMKVIEEVENCFTFNKSNIEDLRNKLNYIIYEAKPYDPKETVTFIGEKYSCVNIAVRYIKILKDWV